MSAAKVDREATAQLWIDNAVSAQTTHKDDVVAGVYAGIAQAHATLALVEQQRIGNLQRERDHASEELKAGIRDGVGSDAKHEKLMHFLDLNNAVRRGLGLA
ncbi:hypothetical protein [Glaciibacter superstes]|uniref:hypothetical protein n=1 Tax=Glaciibacter superstes TaxID=501023 RepID=UPI0003B5C75F|nr:hypothetical protein [Glaciibacter superstes]